MGTIVTRFGRDVSPVLPDENAAAAWLLRHQGQSLYHATTYDGYAFREVPEVEQGHVLREGGAA